MAGDKDTSVYELWRPGGLGVQTPGNCPQLSLLKPVADKMQPPPITSAQGEEEKLDLQKDEDCQTVHNLSKHENHIFSTETLIWCRMI